MASRMSLDEWRRLALEESGLRARLEKERTRLIRELIELRSLYDTEREARLAAELRLGEATGCQP